jgi:pimeloyl-ACP methyl ester carboxylesterase
MRDIPGRQVSLAGSTIYVEERGTGNAHVVFESGMGAGRTLWDPVVALLGGLTHTVTYDRGGRGRSARPSQPQSIDDMAEVMVELVETLIPGRLVLVAHSMGGLIVRRAAESLAHRLDGLVLVDPTPDTAPLYGAYEAAAKRLDRLLGVQRILSRFRPLARLATSSLGSMFSADTYEAMLAEDFTPAGMAQTRCELAAFVHGIAEFRRRPPESPMCDVVVISAARAGGYEEDDHAQIREHQRKYAENVGGRFEDADSEHIVPAERPEQVVAAIRRLAYV